MLVNITEHFIESGREWQVGQNPDVPREVAAMWIADGKATADTDGVRNQSPVSGGGAVAPTAVTGADVLADIAPASPGTWPSLTTYYVSTAAIGVDVGTLAVWVPTDHPTIPAARGWRSQFAPFATVV